MSVLGITCPGPLPDCWLTQRDGLIPSAFSDGDYHVPFYIDNPDCDRFIYFLKQEHRVPRTFSFSLPDKTWKFMEETCVGAMPVADDYVHISPANTFDPAFSPPCFGLVPSHLPLHVLQRPRGQIVAVKKETIFSEPMCRVLASLAPCDFGDVMLNNKILRSHRRLFPRQSRKVLATEVVRSVQGGCAACRTPLLIGLGSGFWLGRRVEDLVFCRNEEGVGHLGAEHEYIFSLTVLQELVTCFRGEFGFDPILDIDSPCGQRILELFRRLQELEAFRDADSRT